MRNIVRATTDLPDAATSAVIHAEAFAAHAIATLLEQGGFEIVAIADSAASVIRELKDNAPTVIVCGIDEVQIDAFTESLRNAFPETHLVLISPADDDSVIAHAWTLGYDSCLSFKHSPEHILAGVALALAGVRTCPKLNRQLLFGEASLPVTNRRNEALLTLREAEVLRGIVQGKSNKAIALELGISASTVKSHLIAILRKTGTANRTQAARWGLEHPP
jgi:DNA-binding NarL/FixJ family response regulator